jgi:hypothetical protein
VKYEKREALQGERLRLCHNVEINVPSAILVRVFYAYCQHFQDLFLDSPSKFTITLCHQPYLITCIQGNKLVEKPVFCTAKLNGVIFTALQCETPPPLLNMNIFLIYSLFITSLLSVQAPEK